MADFLEAKKAEIRERIEELRPLADELARLEGALAALEGAQPATPRPSGAARKPRAPRASNGNGGGEGRRGRPKGSGQRRNQALELIGSRPGITIPEIASELGMQQNYLYRIVPELQKEGLVRKEGRGWHPMEAA